MHLLGHKPAVDLTLILRGIAASGVVWWHVKGHSVEGWSFINIPGRAWVWVFFTLSGYVIAHGFVSGRYRFNRQDLTQFYINRLLRLMPIFWTVSLAALLVMFYKGQPSPIDWRDIPAQLMGFQWSHKYVLSGVFWTLGIELQFYLVAPVLIFAIMALTEKNRYLVLPSILVLYLALTAWPAAIYVFLGGSIDNRTVIGNLGHFIAGICFAILVAPRMENRLSQRQIFLDIILPTLVGLSSIGAAGWLYHERPIIFWSGFGAIVVNLATLMLLKIHVVVERKNVRAGFLTSLGLALGTLSYGLYAWHDFVMRVFDDDFAINLPTVFSFSLILAYLSWLSVERASTALRRKITPFKSSKEAINF